MAEDGTPGRIDAALDAGQGIPAPMDIGVLCCPSEFKCWLWALTKVDPALLEDTLQRVNINLPRRMLYRLNACARNSGKIRSGFTVRIAIGGRESANA